MVINMDVQDNGNILVEEENTIYEIDGGLPFKAAPY